MAPAGLILTQEFDLASQDSAFVVDLIGQHFIGVIPRDTEGSGGGAGQKADGRDFNRGGGYGPFGLRERRQVDSGGPGRGGANPDGFQKISS
jgi:hypothetical protein